MGDFLLRDTSSGEEVRVPEAEAYAGIAEGRLAPREEDVPQGRVRIIWRGRPAYVPIENLPTAVTRDGFGGFDTIAQAEDRARGRELSSELGPLEAPVAAAAGVLRGGSLGLSDAAVAGVDALTGGDLASDFRVLQDRNRGASVLGEVAGAVAPAVVAPTTVLGRAVTAPTRAIAGLSGAAGAAARGALGTGILGRAAGGLAAGAVEGIAGAGAMLLTDAALGRSPELTAESIIQDVGFGGLLGGALGGTLGAASGLARAGGRYGLDAARVLGRRFLDETGTQLHPTVARWWGMLSGAEPGDLVALTRRDPGGLGERARRYIIGGEEVTMADVRRSMARLQSLETPLFSPRGFAGGSARRAIEAVESVRGRPVSHPASQRADTIDGSPATTAEAWDQLWRLRSDPDVADLAEAALRREDAFGEAARRYRAYSDASAALASAYDDAAYLAARRRLEDAAGRSPAVLREAEEVASAAQEAATVRAQWWRVISPEASIMGRAILGHVVGGPVAAAVGAAAGVLSQPAIVIRMMGAMESLGARLEGRVSDLASTVTSARTAARRASHASYREALKTWREQQRQMEELRPRVLAERLGEATAQFGPEADGVRSALQQRMVQLAALRRSIMPAPVTQSNSLTPHLNRLDPNPVEMDRFMRLSVVLDDPLVVVERVADGTIQPDEVELMRAAYPATYQAVVGAVMERLTMLHREPSYEHRLALSILLGVPTDPTLSPEFLSAVQTGYAMTAQGGGQSPQVPRPQRPLRADARPAATEMQELAL